MGHISATSTSVLNTIVAGTAVVDVVLKVIKVEDPVTITSRKTGKDYVVMNINCANDRGDVVRVNAWGKEIDAVKSRLVLNSLSKFEHLSAADVLNLRYHVGPFKFVLTVQRETQVTVLAGDYTLKGLPLSKSSEINMSAFNRHRINCSITKEFVDHNSGMIGYGEMLQPDLRRTGIQLQIRLAEKAPLYRYSLVPGKVVILSGSVGRKNQLIEMVVNSVADIEAGQSSSSSAASKQAAVKLFSADDLLQFTGPAGRAAVEGDIVGEMVDLECDSGETFSLAIYIEDASGFTALTVHLQGLGDVLKSSMTVGSRARIVGTLQILDGELVLVAQAKEVSLNGEYGLSDAPSNMVVTQVPQYQAEDVLRMREDSVLCKVRCVVVKPFDVDGQGAVGVVMMLGKRNVALKVQLTFDGVEDVAEKLLRRAKVELEGTLLRDEALKFTMVTTDASKVTVLEDINASFAGSSPYTPTSSTPFDFGNASKSSSSSALRTIDNTPTFLKVKVEPEDAYELYGGGSELQNSTPKIPNGKRRQQLRDRYKCSEGVPKKKIVLYDLTDDEAVEGANSSESEDIEGENQ